MNMIIAENLRKLRTERNLAQKELCDELLKQNIYLNRSTYTKYENAARTVPYDVLCALAVYHNVSTDFILGLTLQKNKTGDS